MTDTIARYTFLPWMRRGLGTNIAAPDNLGVGASGQGERAEIALTLRVNDAADVTNTVRLFGPGDITGIDARAVVRTDPRAGVTDFEPNYLAAVEFYEEDFPWRYTPARAASGHRLRPWIALVALTEDEFTRQGIMGPLPAIKVASPGIVLPRPGELWAWAHGHVSRDLLAGGGGEATVSGALASTLAENPDLAVSRLLCPRKLAPNTGYHAFVIPSFETGRLAGTGQEIPNAQDGLAPAWGEGQDLFPVYYEWYFRTGERGDFEYLVRLLQPRPLDPRVGIRDMDVTDAGFGLPPTVSLPALGLEGALKTPQTTSTEWPDPAPFQGALGALVNLPETLTEPGAHQDPIVAPPLYGRWHALVRRVAESGNPRWVDELNLDPRHRATAGFGTRVVQKEQEPLMESAWRQVGDVLAANRRLKRAQYAREASLKLFTRHLAGRDEDVVLAMTQPVHARVRASPLTVRRLVTQSRVPAAAVDPAFRRVVRSRGPLRRRLGPGAGARSAVLGRINRGEITAAPAKPVPARQISTETLGDRLFPSWASPGLRALLPSAHWLVLGLLAVILGLNLAAPFAAWTNPVFLASVAALGAAYAYLRANSARWRAAAMLSERRFTPAIATETPPRPDFRITRRDEAAPAPGPPPPQTGGVASESVEAAHFRAALRDTHLRLAARIPQPAPPVALDMTVARAAVLTALHPDRAMPARVLSVVRVPAPYLDGKTDPIEPVMAAPSFPQPMYEPLRDISAELLVPNLDLIPLNTISLLQTNERFVEAYMVGLNHEMARELLWREYPTDQRGSYFRQFWDVSDVVEPAPAPDPAVEQERRLDIKRIHEWGRAAALGDNANRPLPSGEERAVLVLRSDLLKKYPTTVIYAAQAVWPEGFGGREMGTVERYPLFHAEVGPDLTFVGFDLTIPEAKGSSERADGQPGWFFVLKQRPGEPRFGLDAAEAPAPTPATSWDDISWGNLAATPAEFDAIVNVDLSRPTHNIDVSGPNNPDHVAWAANAADMAYILYQDPVLVAVHASEMVP